MSNTVIELKNLCVCYGRHCALRNINLEITEKNEFLALIGPNGAGKSTLLKVLLGLVKPSSGKVEVFGKSPHAVRGMIGYVPQHVNFNRNFPISVFEVIFMGRLKGGLQLFHSFSKQDNNLVEEIMEKLNISYLKNRQISKLSGGELQRVLIARALAADPKLMLLDEPTASVDARSRSLIYSIVKSLNDENMPVILVTHDIGVVSSYVKTIACLNIELYYHGEAVFDSEVMEEVYGCPVELVAHGFPHRVLRPHREGENV